MASELQFKTVTVAAVTSDITRVRLAPLSPFTFTPGQYIQIWCPDTDEWLSCSIVNIPSDTGEIELVLRHNTETPSVNAFLKKAEQSGHFTAKGPLGHCILPEHPIDSLILVAGGTGIAPFLSLLLSKPTAKKIHLFWGARRVIDFYCLSALEAFCDLLPFQYTLVLSETDTSWTGATGLVHEKLAEACPEFKKEFVFSSGPFPMVEKTWATCKDRGLPPTQFFSDMMPTPK